MNHPLPQRGLPLGEPVHHHHGRVQDRPAVPETSGATGSEILIFSRAAKLDALGTMAYTFLGTADYVRHTGDRPIGITWQLRRPMPADLFTQARVAG